MDLAEEPEIHMDAYIRIRRHGSCRGAWDTYGCWAMDPAAWILQTILRYTWMLRHESRDMDLAEVLRHESEDVDLVEDPYWWTLRHESETWLLQRILRYEVHRRCLFNTFPVICRGASYWEADVKDLLLLSSYTLFGVACRYNFWKVHWNSGWLIINLLDSKTFLTCQFWGAHFCFIPDLSADNPLVYRRSRFFFGFARLGMSTFSLPFGGPLAGGGLAEVNHVCFCQFRWDKFI